MFTAGKLRSSLKVSATPNLAKHARPIELNNEQSCKLSQRKAEQNARGGSPPQTASA